MSPVGNQHTSASLPPFSLAKPVKCIHCRSHSLCHSLYALSHTPAVNWSPIKEHFETKKGRSHSKAHCGCGLGAMGTIAKSSSRDECSFVCCIDLGNARLLTNELDTCKYSQHVCRQVQNMNQNRTKIWHKTQCWTLPREFSPLRPG